MASARRLGAVAVAVALARAADTYASPQDVIGFGPRSAAMAGAGAAVGEGFEAVYTNPALLARTPDMSASVGLVGVTFDLDANGPWLADGMSAMMLGGALPIPLPEPLGRRFTMGFGFYTPFDLVVRSRILFPENPQFLISDAVQSIGALVGVGVDLLCDPRKGVPGGGCSSDLGLRIGGGFQMLATLASGVVVAVDGAGRLGAVVQNTLIATYAPLAGVALDLPEDVRVGASFRGALVGRFDVRIDVRDLGELTIPPIFVSGTAQYDPLTAQVEVAKRFDWVTAQVGVGYRRWSDYPGLADPTVRCPLDTTTFALPTCGALRRNPPGFTDSVLARVGAEVGVPLRDGLALDVRAGYSFESAPGPLQDREENLFAEARSVLGLGVGARVGEPIATGLTLSAFGQLGVLHGREHTKASVSFGESYATSGTILAGGTAVGVAF